MSLLKLIKIEGYSFNITVEKEKTYDVNWLPVGDDGKDYYVIGKTLYLPSLATYVYPTTNEALLTGYLRSNRSKDYRALVIPELEKFILEQSEIYYKKGGVGGVDDVTYDKYEDRLRYLDPNNKVLKKVGSGKEEKEVFDGFPKEKHRMFMGSQQKAKNIEEFEKWFKKRYDAKYIIQFKFDGISLELQYDDGNLIRAVTRGDGDIGDDITNNVRKMKGVETKLPSLFTGSLRGEIIMDRQVFKERFSDDYKNPRNLAAGFAKQKDGKGCEYLTVIIYDIYHSSDGGEYKNELDKIDWFKSNLKCFTHSYILSSSEDIEQLYTHLSDKRQEIPYDIDGIVIKSNISKKEDMLRDRPERQIALKFPPTEAETILLKVEWYQSGSTYTPVAILEPISISGSTVTKASLANPNLIIRLGIKIGDRVVVTKRGDIIPKIERVSDSIGDEEVKIPTKCFTCASDLINDGTKLYCSNEECSSLLLHSMEKWIKVMDIKEFGKEMIKALYREKIVKRLSDLYLVQTGQLANLILTGRRVGEKNAVKAYDNLHSLKEISLSKFIAGFDIPSIGERVIDMCVEGGYDTLDKLRAATTEQLATLSGIGLIKGKMIVDGMKKNIEEMKEMLKYIKIKNMKDENISLAGLSFAFTGTLPSMSRNKAAELVKNKGGSIKSTVSKGLTYLVTVDADSASKKNLDAKKLGVKVIGEEEFLKLVA